MKNRRHPFLQIFSRKFERNRIISKKIVLLVIPLLLAVPTFAWFTTSDSVRNNLSSGHLSFDVILKDGFEKLEEVEPAVEIDKVVSAKNTEKQDAFVRLMVFPVATRDGEPLEVNIGDQVTLIGLDRSNWLTGDDGYYYYLGKLSPGQTAPDLFKKVKLMIPDDKKEMYKDAKFDIVVKTEAINTNKYDYRVSWWGNENPPQNMRYQIIDNKLKEIAK